MNTETIKRRIKEDFGFVDNPIPTGWGTNSINLWITKQNLTDKNIIAIRLYGRIMSRLNKTVEYANSKAGCDCIIDGIKKEVRMATVSKDVCTLNQIKLDQSWDDIIVVLFFHNREEIYETSKENFINICKEQRGKILWNGGKKIIKADKILNQEEDGDFNIAMDINIFGEKFDKII